MEKDSFMWYKVRDLGNEIIQISDNSLANMYIIKGDKKAMLIDTGWGMHDLEEVIKSITDLPLIVVNTHGHLDHVSGNYNFKEFYISAYDESILRTCFDKEFRISIVGSVLRGPYYEAFDKGKWINNVFPEPKLIRGKEVFDLGNRMIEVIETPGHTTGSICLLDRNTGTLLAGDSISNVQLWLHLEESTALTQYLESMERLHAYGDRVTMIHAGHATNMDRGMTREIIKCLKAIIGGETKGVPYHTFAGDGLIAKFDSCSIVYDENRV